MASSACYFTDSVLDSIDEGDSKIGFLLDYINPSVKPSDILDLKKNDSESDHLDVSDIEFLTMKIWNHESNDNNDEFLSSVVSHSNT